MGSHNRRYDNDPLHPVVSKRTNTVIRNSTFTYIFSYALVIGALLWAYKAIAILATGDQPALVFEIAPIFFAVGLVDLASRRHKHRRSFKVIGYALFVATLGGVIVGFVWVSEAIDTLFGGPLLTLLVLGGSVARYGLWPGKWRYVPLALGLSVVPVVPRKIHRRPHSTQRLQPLRPPSR